MERKKILLAITSNTGRETYLIPFAHSLINNTRNLSNDYDLEVHVFGGLSIDLVRTSAAQYSLKHKFDALVFFDDDMILPPNALSKLVKIWDNEGIPMVSGTYTSKAMPFHSFIFPIGSDDWLRKYDNTKRYEVATAATGCLLIDTKVFTRLPKPWFLLRRDLNGYISSTEDCYFTNLCHKAGIRMVVDASIECQHLKLVAFPSYFDDLNISYKGEWREPPKTNEKALPQSKGPIIIHPLKGSRINDGIDECCHLHQYPVPTNVAEESLYQCLDCGLVSTGEEFAGLNVLTPKCCNPQDLDRLVKEMDDLE